jgi:hypothetical protein
LLSVRFLIGIGLGVFVAAAAGSALELWHAHGTLATLPTVCPIRLVTGVDCPGCGMGRALAMLADGNVSASLQRHPFAFPLVVGAALCVLLPGRLVARGRASRLAVGQVLPAVGTAVLLTWWAMTRLA